MSQSPDAFSGSRWVRAPHVLWRRSLDAVHVLPEARDEPLTLGGTGPELWALLADPRDVEDIVAVLAEHHGVDRGVVADDIVPLLARLERLGVARRVEGAAEDA